MLEWFGKRLRHMQEVKRDERGFTLIELLIVVIIIGILAAIAIPIFLAQRADAQNNAARSQLRAAASAQAQAQTETSTYLSGVAPVAGDDLTDFSFRQGTPPVSVTSADADDFCMRAQSESGTNYYITDDNTVPTTTACS